MNSGLRSEKSLAIFYPDIAKEWHPTKNDNLTPNDVTKGSGKKVWWICPKEHEYQSIIKLRVRGNGCPYCAGKKICPDNSLASIQPDIAKEWHPIKNGTITPNDVTKGSGKKIWWLCSNGHSYENSIVCRTSQHQSCPYCSGKRVCEDNSLMTQLPHIAKEWHPTKNGSLTPNNVTIMSGKKVWWICPRGHEYESLCSSRSKNSGCPYCDGKKACKENSLLSIFPGIAKEWHPNRNHELTPDKITKKSNKKVWWLCPVNHEYQAAPKSRSNGTDCPYCAGNKVCTTNCLATLYPNIAKEWHPTKNGILTPENVTKGSNKIVWWLCPKGHEYKTAIYTRANGGGCRYCSSQTSRPEIRILTELMYIFPNIQWRKKLNAQEVDIYISEIQTAIEYDGAYYHGGNKHIKDVLKNKKLEEACINLIRFREKPLAKIMPNDILVHDISKKDIDDFLLKIQHLTDSEISQKIQDYLLQINFQNESKYREFLSFYPSPLPEDTLLYKRPDLAKEWDLNRNFPLVPEHFSIGSSIKVYWRCPMDHSYKAPIKDRARGSNCPYCAGKRACSENSIANLLPLLAKEWHPTKNGTLTPNDVTRMSGRKIWWICPKGHEYEAICSSRSNNRGCPYCAGKRTCKNNNFTTLLPQLAKEWHPIKNGALTSNDVTKGSSKKIWWLCSKGHEYIATPNSRANGSNCPYCSRINNSLATIFPILAQEWHPIKNCNLNPNNVTKGSNKKVWWLCPKGHEYLASINNRAGKNSTCPYCAGKKVHADNCLFKLSPNIAKEWHPTKNGKLTPYDVTNSSHKKVWWVCAKGHEYEAICSSRSRGTGCPFCAGKIK